MEFMYGGYDENILKQFVSIKNKRRVTMGDLTFEVNEEVISKATSLAMEGREWKNNSKMSDYDDLNQLFNPIENLVNKYGGLSREDLSGV